MDEKRSLARPPLELLEIKTEALDPPRCQKHCPNDELRAFAVDNVWLRVLYKT